MRADRIVRRNQYRTAFPSFHPGDRLLLMAKSAGMPVVSREKTYHKFLVDSEFRHPSFQRLVRSARVERGLRPTSTDMHRACGRSTRTA